VRSYLYGETRASRAGDSTSPHPLESSVVLAWPRCFFAAEREMPRPAAKLIDVAVVNAWSDGYSVGRAWARMPLETDGIVVVRIVV